MRIYIVLLVLFLLTGCGQNQQAVEDPPLDTTPISYDQSDQTEPLFNYIRFNLLVDYEKALSYKVHFDQYQKIAEIQELKDQRIMGEEAFNQLSPRLSEMSFDEDTPEQEVVQEVLNLLGLKTSFENFALDVEFDSGLVKHYEY
ncbi:YusW family protein [Halobacillus litoralis]|uniref:YusW family protein n=1 Tax=Halobacillus litoralis TaxID=45668 RepID=UPI001CD36E51|nr:YusW family protein [Halobacillus litoralis]MCA0968990.1 YusW family protein [Halobacillus litoralis]